MPTINVSEQAVIRDRHHRRPRSPGSSVAVIEAFAPSHTYPAGTRFTEPPPDHQPLPLDVAFPDPAHILDFVFWSITDGATGRVDTLDPQLFVNWASTAPTMDAAAWYAPPGGGGPKNGGPSDIMVDAFSTTTGGFIDDDFLTVSSDPSLSAQANQDGWVPTTSAETLIAYPSIGTLNFDRWILVNAGVPADDPAQVDVPAGSGGLAFAVYTPNGLTYTAPSDDADRWLHWVRDIAAVGGLLLTRGEPTTPIEVLTNRLTANSAIQALTGYLGKDAGAAVTKALNADSQPFLNVEASDG